MTTKAQAQDKAKNQTTGNSPKGKAVKDASNLGKMKTFTYYDDDMNQHEGSLDLLASLTAEGSELDKLQDGYNEYRDKLKEKKPFFGNVMTGIALKIQTEWNPSTSEEHKETADQFNKVMNQFWKDNFPEKQKPQYFSQTKSNCAAAIKYGLPVKETPTAGTLNQALNQYRRQAKAETPTTVADAVQALQDAVSRGNKVMKDHKDTASEAHDAQWKKIQDELIQSLMDLRKTTDTSVQNLESSLQSDKPTAEKKAEAADAAIAKAVEQVEGQQPKRRASRKKKQAA